MERLVGFNHDVLMGVRDFAGPSRNWVCHFINPLVELLPQVAAWEPNGVLAFVGNAEIGEAIRSLNVPFVDVAAWVHQPPWPRVGLDDRAIGRLAADYLLERGFEQFAFIGNTELAFSEWRLRGYSETLQAAGYPVRTFAADPKRFPSARAWTMGGVDGELVGWVQALPKPVAVFADNDERALLASEACQVAGVPVPSAVALLGVDDDPYLTGLGYPPISSIATPARRLGYEAAQTLDRLLHGFKAPESPTRLGPVGVVTRRSTDRFAFGDPLVMQALRFIAEKATDGIGVADVVRHVPAGRRTLERRFETYVGRGILDEINRFRLEKARLLVASTDLALAEVAAQCGLGSASRLSTLHREIYGVGTREYRRVVRSG